MYNPHIKFEMSTITCNEEIKGHAKCKNSRFKPPFGGLTGNAQGSSMARWRARSRLPISACHVYTSHACQLGNRLAVIDRSVAADTPGQVGQRPIELEAEVYCAVTATVQN